MTQPNDSTTYETPVQPSLGTLLAGYLARQAEGHTAGLAVLDPTGDVQPFEAGPVQPIDPKPAWDEAVAAARSLCPTVETRSWQAPPHCLFRRAPLSRASQKRSRLTSARGTAAGGITATTGTAIGVRGTTMAIVIGARAIATATTDTRIVLAITDIRTIAGRAWPSGSARSGLACSSPV